MCLDYYYENDVPGMEAQNVAHMPVSLPYNSLLRGDVLLFSNGSPQEDSQVKAIADVLCGADYKKVLDRVEMWFGEGELV